MLDTNNANTQALMSNTEITTTLDPKLVEFFRYLRLTRTVGADDYINSGSPYEFKISLSAHRQMDGWDYLRYLRRLVKSVNLQLIRNAGFVAAHEKFGHDPLDMLDGIAIIQNSPSRPTVEIVCNINQRYCIFDPAEVYAAFESTKCYDSNDHRVPIYDQKSLKVEYLPNGEWNGALAVVPIVLRLRGKRLF